MHPCGRGEAGSSIVGRRPRVGAAAGLVKAPSGSLAVGVSYSVASAAPEGGYLLLATLLAAGVCTSRGGRKLVCWLLACPEQVMISGPDDTPYSGGLFLFDIYFPSGYPASPPKVRLMTTGGGQHRFNPNLYAGERESSC